MCALQFKSLICIFEQVNPDSGASPDDYRCFLFNFPPACLSKVLTGSVLILGSPDATDNLTAMIL